MISEKLFIDSDILLDLFYDRKPHSQYAIKLFDVELSEKLNLCTSTLVTANLHYIITKQRNKKYANECITSLLKYMQVLAFEPDAIDYSLASKFDDFEDAIQYYIAKKNNCSKILSRNIKDYKLSLIPVVTAEYFFKN